MFIRINFEALLSVPVIITFIIALLFSIFFISLDYREKKDEIKTDKDRRKKKSFYRQRLFFTFLLGVCALYEAYTHKIDEIESALVQAVKDSTINAKQDLNTAITKKLDSTSNELDEKNDALIASQKNIIKAQGYSIRLQNELYNQITGGNSIPILTVKAALKTKGSEMTAVEELLVIISNSGKYPIKNIEIEFEDYSVIYPTEFEPQPNIFLPADTSITVKKISLVPGGWQQKHHLMKFRISWKNLYYDLVFTLIRNDLPPIAPNQIQIKYLTKTLYYFYKGKEYETVDKLKDQLLKTAFK